MFHSGLQSDNSIICNRYQLALKVIDLLVSLFGRHVKNLNNDHNDAIKVVNA